MAAPSYDLITQHAETLRLMSPYSDIEGWIAKLHRPDADRSAEAAISLVLALKLTEVRRELEPVIATLAAKEAAREIEDLAELLTDARDESMAAFDREVSAANPLALQAALERVGADIQPQRAA